jgi:outer membrane lipoprotein-sorting protein/Tol biopolymer transport system component
MNDERYPLDSESGDSPLKEAVQSILAEPIPEDAIQRVKSRARLLANPSAVALPVEHGSRTRRWKASRALVGGLTVAAVLITVAGVIRLLDHSGQAFAQVIEKVKATRSAHCKTAMRFGHRPEIDGQLYVEGSRLRLEQLDGMLIQVADFDRKQALFLDVRRKVAQLAEIDAAMARAFANPIDQLRHANTKNAEQMGEEILRGRRTQVYRLHKVDLLGMKGDGEMLVWVDVESQLPAKIVVRDPDPKAEMEIRFDEFVWNEPLDAGLFSLSIPEGFQKGIVIVEPPRAEPAQPGVGSPESPNALADGILSSDRVPIRIVWEPPGTTITALMMDPESVPPLSRRPNELRQWDVATGKLRWSEAISGAGWVAGTADGKSLATVIGYEVQLRDAASGKITRKWATDKPLSPLAFSPDGKTLAAGITEWGPFGGSGGKPSGGVQFWDVERASLLRSITDDKPITFVAYSSNGKYLATSSNEGPVKLWDAATGELTRIVPGLFRASFSPDGKTIACASATSSADKTVGKVDLYNLQDGSLVRSFTSEKGASTSNLLWVTFSPDGRLLAASDWNGTVTLWNVATDQRKQATTGQKAGVHSVAFAPDGATLAIGSEDKTLRLWKLPAEMIERGLEKK